MIPPLASDLERRRPIWAALSDLFLDTELEERDLDLMAEAPARSPYTLEELEHVLYHEVYPILIWNLWSVAGEWAGIDPEWLEQRILAREERRLKWPSELQTGRSAIRTEWDQVKRKVEAIRGSPSFT